MKILVKKILCTNKCIVLTFMSVIPNRLIHKPHYDWRLSHNPSHTRTRDLVRIHHTHVLET